MADEEHSWAEAVAIKDGEIVFVGSNHAANPYIGNNTEVTDLGGKMLMPGFHDAHAQRFAAIGGQLHTGQGFVDDLQRPR